MWLFSNPTGGLTCCVRVGIVTLYTERALLAATLITIFDYQNKIGRACKLS